MSKDTALTFGQRYLGGLIGANSNTLASGPQAGAHAREVRSAETELDHFQRLFDEQRERMSKTDQATITHALKAVVRMLGEGEPDPDRLAQPLMRLIVATVYYGELIQSAKKLYDAIIGEE